jgi:DNA-directed RNA polymerase subunit RPC12/RpoP
MALTKCKECGKEVSTTAKKCPHCGYDFESRRMMQGCLVLFAIFIALVFALTYFGSDVSHP